MGTGMEGVLFKNGILHVPTKANKPPIDIAIILIPPSLLPSLFGVCSHTTPLIPMRSPTALTKTSTAQPSTFDISHSPRPGQTLTP